MLGLAGCQSLPVPEQEAPKQQTPKEVKKDIHTPSGVVIHPYDHPDIQRQRIVIPKQQERVQQFDDGRNLPAFKKLMQQTQNAYAKGQFNQAEDDHTGSTPCTAVGRDLFIFGHDCES